VGLLRRLTSRGGWVFDVGANIGAIALPLLEGNRDTHVVSFEPSPNSLPYLLRTHAGSPYRDRWVIVEKALSDTQTLGDFHIADAARGAFDGFADTGRAGPTREITVPVTRLDTEWARLGRPRVAVIKIDVEGAELGVLGGARECLAAQRPPVLTEWNAENLRAYRSPAHCLFDFAKEHGFEVYGVPSLVRATDGASLAVLMLQTESFLLWPSDLQEPYW
jgi:FkbM family methyltransferase